MHRQRREKNAGLRRPADESGKRRGRGTLDKPESDATALLVFELDDDCAEY